MPITETTIETPDIGTRVAPKINRNPGAASRVTVTEYEHFISFSLENYEGQQIFIQYRRDQVWRDEAGVWQVKNAQQPFYTSRSAAPQPPEVKLCPAILSAFHAKLATSG